VESPGSRPQASDSWWQRCKGLLSRRTEPTLCQQVQAFLDLAPLSSLVGSMEVFREQARRELRAARKAVDASLLVVAARYFFRWEVEANRELFQGLSFAQREQVGHAQETAFTALAEALGQHSGRLQALLGDVLEAAVETRFIVLDILAEQAQQKVQMQELYDAMMQLKRRHDLALSEVRRCGATRRTGASH
jgi:hypothetical protein